MTLSDIPRPPTFLRKQMTEEEYQSLPIYFDNIEDIKIGGLYRARTSRKSFAVKVTRTKNGYKELIPFEIDIVEEISK